MMVTLTLLIFSNVACLLLSRDPETDLEAAHFPWPEAVAERHIRGVRGCVLSPMAQCTVSYWRGALPCGNVCHLRSRRLAAVETAALPTPL